MKKIKLRKLMCDKLWDAYFGRNGGMGQSKHENYDKRKIYSHETYNTYLKAIKRFSSWCKLKNIKDFEEAREYVPAYLEECKQIEGISAYTISTWACALGKVFDCSITNFGVELPKRRRADIKRSRGYVKNDNGFSPERNKEIITFCQCTGLRRHELECVKGSDLKYYKGSYWIQVGKAAKGGRPRLAPIVAENEKEKNTVIRLMQRAGDGLVFSKVNTKMDVHSYRSIYACRLYKKIAEDTNSLSREQLYICRRDRKGIVYDRKALRFVSLSLGHNRINIVPSNYLYNL